MSEMKAILLAALLLFSACTDPPVAERAIYDMGLTNAKIGGYGWFSCGRDDFYSTKFEATNVYGKRVSGVVCSQFIFKNAKVRFQ